MAHLTLKNVVQISIKNKENISKFESDVKRILELKKFLGYQTALSRARHHAALAVQLFDMDLQLDPNTMDITPENREEIVAEVKARFETIIEE